MTEAFGMTKKGEKASMYRLENGQGMQAYVTDFGATLVKLLVPDKDGTAAGRGCWDMIRSQAMRMEPATLAPLSDGWPTGSGAEVFP